jgi:hypothetical protein
MSFEPKISGEISPFFRFANSENPSKSISTWTDSNQRVRTHLAYENCVSCNTKRFTSEGLSNLRLGTDTYFCHPCFKKVAEVVKKYDKGVPSEEYEIFNKLWNDSLFGKSKL